MANKILYCRSFGLGNAICAIPSLKALRALDPDAQIDVLVGTGPDDGGAALVFEELKKNVGVVNNIWKAITPDWYDRAILAIPYDHRWGNGLHFTSRAVYDGRTRPDPSTTGFVSWKKHEIEYQIDVVKEMYKDQSVVVPSTYFGYHSSGDNNRVFVGMGYKKDAAGFWKVKHWGNENYAKLIKGILESDHFIEIVTSGDILDLKMTINPVLNLLSKGEKARVFVHPSQSLKDAFKLIETCCTYVGNDTGMMHVAAAADLKIAAYFQMENSWTKSHPWCNTYEILQGHENPVTVEQFYEAYERVHYAED